MTLNAVLVISYRDLVKFLRDPARWFWSFIFPLLMIGIFGETMRANLGRARATTSCRSRSPGCWP